MLSIRKHSLIFFGAAFFTAVAVADVSDYEMIRLCDCDDLSFQQPHNENSSTTKEHKSCTKESSTDVSWHSWLVGDSRSKQFHYLDLLELLFRSDGRDSESAPPSYE
ncbi:hypothetical protein KIH87_18050 [Paraneptunicella aestuarii]|uniref:hypothetical protein n=1 Tax=Paraneptunicella aestuarii TaxID=2831148 RepID=UPI001E5C83BB|nr:hypothetical protein [Paraneptunicella aestuarii]UAA40891.1 hypothetical protein KIH87_18050 [Paraneptunicella aestuarii]